jgi:hypothetical protein
MIDKIIKGDNLSYKTQLNKNFYYLDNLQNLIPQDFILI